MNTTTESAPLPLTHKYTSAIASLLTPGQWDSVQDDKFRDDYVRCEHGTIAYMGNDPLLQGAAITGYLTGYLSIPPRGDGKVEWSCNLHAHQGGASRFLLDCLTYGERQAWPGSCINISASKAPAQVAKELQRRLLSYYLPAYRAGMEGWQRENAQHAADVALAEELAVVLGSKVGFEHNNALQSPHVWTSTLGGLLSVSNGRVRIERSFSLSAQQALELCRLVATWKGEGQ